MKVVILPAAGKQTRMGSDTPKQLLPLGDGKVIDCALEAAKLADCWVHVIVPKGDERIAKYVGEGSFSYGIPGQPLADIASLRPIYEGAQILYIMPDTVFEPRDIGGLLFDTLEPGYADVSLACFHTDDHQRYGMCFQGQAGIYTVVDKPTKWDVHGRGDLAWGLIAWQDILMWDAIESNIEAGTMSEPLREVLGYCNWVPYTVLDSYTDIGTPQNYHKATEPDDRRVPWV